MQPRLLDTLEATGLLLVQGQWELPAIADLLAGRPVTTKGYSWDYVPAWQTAWELTQHADVAECKLWRGMRTLVHRALFLPVAALAQRAYEGVIAGRAGQDARELLTYIERNDGVTGAQIKAQFGWDARSFQRYKRLLESSLQIYGHRQDEGEEEGHTHDLLWQSWRTASPIHAATQRVKTRPPIPEAVAQLLAPAGLHPQELTQTKLQALLPVLKLCRP